MSFKRLDTEDFLVSAQTVVQPAWSGNVVELSTFVTSPTQISSPSSKYFYNVYDKDETSGGEVQFNIAYASINGSGASPYNSQYPEKSPASTLYGQYRTLLLEDEDATFPFLTETDITKPLNFGFYVINISRARYKEKLYPFDFTLSFNNSIENSLTVNKTSSPTYRGTQRVFDIVKGKSGAPDSGNNPVQGWFLPDIGVILIGLNQLKALTGLTGPEIPTLAQVVSKFYRFKLYSEETVTSNYIFVRARNSEFNYSENPSFMKGTNGEVQHDIFINNPQVFPTSVGLYNDSNDLLAVVKLSRPIVKDFTKELLLRIKIDY